MTIEARSSEHTADILKNDSSHVAGPPPLRYRPRPLSACFSSALLSIDLRGGSAFQGNTCPLAVCHSAAARRYTAAIPARLDRQQACARVRHQGAANLFQDCRMHLPTQHKLCAFLAIVLYVCPVCIWWRTSPAAMRSADAMQGGRTTGGPPGSISIARVEVALPEACTDLFPDDLRGQRVREVVLLGRATLSRQHRRGI